MKNNNHYKQKQNYSWKKMIKKSSFVKAKIIHCKSETVWKIDQNRLNEEWLLFVLTVVHSSQFSTNLEKYHLNIFGKSYTINLGFSDQKTHRTCQTHSTLIILSLSYVGNDSISRWCKSDQNIKWEKSQTQAS